MSFIEKVLFSNILWKKALKCRQSLEKVLNFLVLLFINPVVRS